MSTMLGLGGAPAGAAGDDGRTRPTTNTITKIRCQRISPLFRTAALPLIKPIPQTLTGLRPSPTRHVQAGSHEARKSSDHGFLASELLLCIFRVSQRDRFRRNYTNETRTQLLGNRIVVARCVSG